MTARKSGTNWDTETFITSIERSDQWLSGARSSSGRIFTLCHVLLKKAILHHTEAAMPFFLSTSVHTESILFVTDPEDITNFAHFVTGTFCLHEIGLFAKFLLK